MCNAFEIVIAPTFLRNEVRLLCCPHIMIIGYQQLTSLSFRAKASPRLRQNYDLRNTPEDNSQRMLNALEPGTVMPIHRHRKSSETVVIVRGSLIERFYDEEGNVTEAVLMAAGGENPVV